MAWSFSWKVKTKLGYFSWKSYAWIAKVNNWKLLYFQIFNDIKKLLLIFKAFLLLKTYILRILINLLARKIILVQGEVVVVLTQRQIIHLIDEILKLWILLTCELLNLLPNFFAFRVLFRFSADISKLVSQIVNESVLIFTHNCFSFRNLLLHSSKSLWFISMKSWKRLKRLRKSSKNSLQKAQSFKIQKLNKAWKFCFENFL